MKKISAKELQNYLLDLDLHEANGVITFKMANTTVKIHTTDIVGNSIQSWLEQFLIDNDYYFRVPENTQQFPDFYLDERNDMKLLEVKAFNYNATPAFDIANFESYVDSVKTKPYRLDADYLVFGYTMDDNGNINIKRIWLKKIYEISGTSNSWPLKVQDKRGMIYNIRPNSQFKRDEKVPFVNTTDFLKAMYDTLLLYKGEEFTNDWLKELQKNYKSYYHKDLSI